MRHVDQRFRAGGAKISIVLALLTCGLLVALLLTALEKIRIAASLTQTINNLKQVGIGFHAFHDANKRLPFNGSNQPVEGVVYSRTAKPKNYASGSWGWQIVPFIESTPLSTNPEKFDYRLACLLCLCRARHVSTAESDFFLNNYMNDAEQAETPDNADRKRKLDDITDGTSNTILIGHGNISTPEYGLLKGAVGSCSILNGGTFGTARSGPNWVKGQPHSVELRRDSADPPDFKLGGWGGPFSQGGLMAMADATVRMFPYSTSGNPFAAFLTPTGGEDMGLPE